MMETAGRHMYEGAWHYNTCIDPSCPGCATMTPPIPSPGLVQVIPTAARVLAYKTGNGEGFIILTDQEARNLYDYFMDNGYVSHEFHQSIHEIIKRLKEFCEPR